MMCGVTEAHAVRPKLTPTINVRILTPQTFRAIVCWLLVSVNRTQGAATGTVRLESLRQRRAASTTAAGRSTAG